MPDGAIGRRHSIENDSGAGPATAEPPSPSANQLRDDAGVDRLAEESEAQDLALKLEFRRKLAGVRWLPRWARAGARRELYE